MKKPPFGGISLFRVSEDSLEGFRMRVSDLGEDLAVELDVLLLECADEFAVACTLFVERCVDADIPESAEIALLVAAAFEGIRAGMHDCVDRCRFLVSAVQAIALGLQKCILSALVLDDASFDS